MRSDSFSDSAFASLRVAGFLDFELVRARPPDVKHFGDAEAVFRVGTLLLRLVRDRGQEFMDLATIAAPDKFYQFDDVEIAMGWKTIDEVLAKHELEPLKQALARIREHFVELEKAFSGDSAQARVERAARDHGDAFMRRLRGNQQT